MATLFDQYGRPVETPRRPERERIAIATLRDQWSGYPSNGLTPGRLAAILRDADEGELEAQAELFEEMEEKDGHLYSVLQTRRLAVVGLPRTILPASDDQRDQDVAAFCEEQLGKLDFETVMLELLDAIGKGYSVSEILWDLDGGRAVPRSIEWVHAKKFRWDRGTLFLRTEASPALGERLAANKFVVHVYKARAGWTSRAGVLRVCAWTYLFKNFAIKDWVAFAEVFGMPLRLGKYDPSATKEDRDALATAVKAIGHDAAGIISNATAIDFIESKVNKGADVFSALAAWCEAAQSKAVLGQTLTTQVDGKGSYAASKTHDEVRHDLLEADATALAKTLQRDLLRPMVGFNFGWDVALPVLELDTREAEDLHELAETYGTLVSQVHLPIGVDHIYERFGIPAPEDGDPVVDGSPDAAGVDGGGLKPFRRLALAGRRPFAPGAKASAARPVDGLVDAAAAEARPLAARLVEPLRRMVEEAPSLDALERSLLAAYGHLPRAEFEDLAGRALFMARAGGRADG